MSPVSARLALSLTLAMMSAQPGPMAMTALPVTLPDLSSSAARVFRGVCLSSEVGATEFAGARIATTTYTFEVREYLKGGGGKTVTFRQVGTPSGGPRDLGRAAGLPVYTPGLEYVIFLLPESKARLTSPAGASRGAFLVAGEDVIVPDELTGLFPSAAPQGRGATTAAGGGRVPYRTVRESILKTLAGDPPARR
jgi:hypothetical protein